MITDEPTRKLFVAKIPKIPSKSNIIRDYPVAVTPRFQSNFPLGRDFIEEFWTKPIDFSKDINEKMCYKGGICCSFVVNATFITNDPSDVSLRLFFLWFGILISFFSKFSYEYRLAVFQGERTYAGYEFQNVSICGIMACTNNALESCGRLFDDQSKTVQSISFNFIQISLELDEFVGEKEFVIMPSSQDLYLNPLKVTEFELIEKDFGSSNLELIKPHSDLLSFGLYGHIYDKSNSAGHFHKTYLNTIIGTFITTIILYCKF